MDAENRSLICPTRQQLDLIPSDQIPADVFVAEESGTELLQDTPEIPSSSALPATKRIPRNPEFTAARFFVWNPKKYLEIVSLRAEGVSVASICRMYSVSPGTVVAIERREEGTILVGEVKQGAIRSYRYLIRLSCERLQEILIDPASKPSPQQLAIIIGVLQDKIQLLEGQPTSRLEVVERPDVSTYLNLVDRARTMMESSDQGMGLGGERAGQKVREAEVSDADVI